MLELLKYSRLMPEVRNSFQSVGPNQHRGKGGVRIPVAGIAGDQQRAHLRPYAFTRRPS